MNRISMGLAARRAALGLALALAGTAAYAALPAPTPAQQQAAAAKKAQADAQAAHDKASLAASMDAISTRWRTRAAAQGWRAYPPVAIAAAGTGTAAAATGAPAEGRAPAGQPDGKLTPAGAAAPQRSEKHGTAPPSKDVKAGPTKAEPRGAAPAVVKDTPKVHNR